MHGHMIIYTEDCTTVCSYTPLPDVWLRRKPPWVAVCAAVCIRMCACVYVHVRVRVCVCVCVQTYTQCTAETCVLFPQWPLTHTHTYTHTYTHTCSHALTHTHTYTHNTPAHTCVMQRSPQAPTRRETLFGFLGAGVGTAITATFYNSE